MVRQVNCNFVHLKEYFRLNTLKHKLPWSILRASVRCCSSVDVWIKLLGLLHDHYWIHQISYTKLQHLINFSYTNWCLFKEYLLSNTKSKMKLTWWCWLFTSWYGRVFGNVIWIWVAWGVWSCWWFTSIGYTPISAHSAAKIQIHNKHHQKQNTKCNAQVEN